MDKKAKALIRAYIRKAEDKLEVASQLIKLRDYEDAISRAYYAAFHASQAALRTRGLSAKTHQGLISLFGLHLVKTGCVDRKYGRYLAKLKDDRERCDYEVYASVRLNDAKSAVRDAGEFVRGIKQFLTAEIDA